MSIFTPYVQGIQNLVGGGTIAGKPGTPTVIMGPQVVGGQAIPWHHVSRAGVVGGHQPSRFGLQQTGSLSSLAPTPRSQPSVTMGTLFQPTGYHRFLRPEQAAAEYFAEGPGSEVVSAAPGSADLLRDLFSGFLPTLRAQGAQRAVGDGGGWTGDRGAAIGATAPGLGMGLPPWTMAAGGVAALLLVLALARKRRR